jgi:predicted small metal-binding protein
MSKVLVCACGVVLTAFGEDDLLAHVEQHLTRRHAGRGTKAMAGHVVTCGCGHEIWSEDIEELLQLVEEHIRSAHPELIGTLSPLELARKEEGGGDGVAA